MSYEVMKIFQSISDLLRTCRAFFGSLESLYSCEVL